MLGYVCELFSELVGFLFGCYCSVVFEGSWHHNHHLYHDFHCHCNPQYKHQLHHSHHHCQTKKVDIIMITITSSVTWHHNHHLYHDFHCHCNPQYKHQLHVVVVVVDPTPPTCCQQSPAHESCGSQQSLPPGGKERLHFVGIRPEVQARKGGW